MFLLALTLSMTIATTSNAGTLTFRHGNDGYNKSVGGSMSSTTTESLMRVDTRVKYSSTGNTFHYKSSDYKNKKSASNWQKVGSTKGSPFYWYYRNGVQKHKSTAWFNFNF